MRFKGLFYHWLHSPLKLFLKRHIHERVYTMSTNIQPFTYTRGAKTVKLTVFNTSIDDNAAILITSMCYGIINVDHMFGYKKTGPV